MKKIILLSLSFALNIVSYSQTHIWGLTSEGGKYGGGVIFSTDAEGDNYQVRYDFEYIDAEYPDRNDLIQATNGNFYGVVSRGGNSSKGVLFEYNPVTARYKKLFDFNDSLGSFPEGSLLQTSDGMLYGTTSEGGHSGAGVLFQYDVSNAAYTVKVNFGSSTSINGKHPYGSLIQATDGMLYGTTSADAINFPGGVIFQYNPTTNTYTEKFTFDNPSNGNTPHGSLFQASDGMLYGMTNKGGTNDRGTLFQYNPVNLTFTKKIDFQGQSNGGNPFGSLIQAKNGLLYGMTSRGGINDQGIIFEYNTNTSLLEKKFDFNLTDGTSPKGSLVKTKDGMLYGLTENDGSEDGIFLGKGVLFQFDPSSYSYTKRIFFGKNASYLGLPKGNLLLASDGQLYGMVTDGRGAVFQFDPAESKYAQILVFNSSIESHSPYGSLVQANDGMLYGVTEKGGIYNRGTLFQYNPISLTYIKKFDFKDYNTGTFPQGSLIKTMNGMLYGLTTEGFIFQYDPSTSTQTKKADLNVIGIANPKGSLVEANDGMFYGMSSSGILFQYNPVTTALTSKVNISMSVYGSLLNASDGKLYGLTYNGGNDNQGTLFQYDPATSTYTKKFDFGWMYGGFPYGSLIQAKDGMFYGLTSKGGINDQGIIFKYDPVTSKQNKIFDFNDNKQPDGKFPYGTPLQSSNGKLYGMTRAGGVNKCGTLFEYNIKDSVFTKKLDFNKINGATPYYTQLIETTLPNSIKGNNLAKILSLFPNPTTGIINITVNSSEKYKIKSVELYNILGEQLGNLSLNESSVNVSSQSNGVYFIKINTDKGTVVKKVVKQ